MEYEGAHRLRVEGSAGVHEADRGSPTGDGSAPGLVST